MANMCLFLWIKGLQMKLLDELIFWAPSPPYSPDLAPMHFVSFPYLNSMREQRFSDPNALRYATKTLYKNLTNNGMKAYFIIGLIDMKSVWNWKMGIQNNLTGLPFSCLTSPDVVEKCMVLCKSNWCKVKIAVYFEKKF